MQYLRFAAALYWAALTVLLLAPNPWALLGFRPVALPHGGQGVHFVMFTMLGLSVFLAGLPMRAWIVAAMLALYGVTIEMLQYFIPLRMVDARDLAENLVGLALGAGLFLAGRWLARVWHRRRHGPEAIKPPRDPDPAAALAATHEVAHQRAGQP